MMVFYHEGDHDHPTGWYYRAKHYDGKGAVQEWGHSRGRSFASRKAAEDGLKRHQQHSCWYKIWRAAWNNMPSREWHATEWVPQEPNTTPLADFIKQNVKGKMKIIDNTVHKLTVNPAPTQYGSQSALAVLMGYNVLKGGHSHVYVNLIRGSRPKDPEKRELLLKLASKDGKKLALAMLAKLRPTYKYQ